MCGIQKATTGMARPIMRGRMWMVVLAICVQAIVPALTKTPWMIRATSKYELRFYNYRAANFEAANTLCKNDSGFMVRMDDEQVRSIIYETIKGDTSVQYFWIGATGSMSSWIWLDGTRVDKSILTWSEGQPDNYEKLETRLVLWKTSKYSDVAPQTHYAGTICQRYLVANASGHYLSINRRNYNGDVVQATYYEAISKCKSFNSRLAVVDDTTSNALSAILRADEYHWVNATAAGECQSFAKNGLKGSTCTIRLPYICEQVGVYSIKAANLILTQAAYQEINCSAEGFPIPNVEWKRLKVLIPESRQEKMYQYKVTGLATLHLANAKVTDEGKYTCVASNIVEGTPYEIATIVQLKVPSKPTILRIEAHSCNSSLTVKWRPHVRAAGMPHRLQVTKVGESRYQQKADPTPIDTSTQFFVSTNLSSSTLYTVMITACTSCLTPYSVTGNGTTGGIPRPVALATLRKLNGSCKVSWSLLSITPSTVITGYKVTVHDTIAKFPDGTIASSSVNTYHSTARSLSYEIPKRPNRKYNVTVQSVSCSGFGGEVIANGECITDTAAPTVVPTPRNSSAILEDGRIFITVRTPDNENGPISCIFLVVQPVTSGELEVSITEKKLRALNSTHGQEINQRGTIAMAVKQGRSSEPDINLIGDNSTSACNIQGTSERNDAFTGRNHPLNANHAYWIYLITSTPSNGDILFQISDPLLVGQSKFPETASPVVYIASSIGTVALIAIVLVIVFVYRRTTKIDHGKRQETNEPEEQTNTYEYPSFEMRGQEEQEYVNTRKNAPELVSKTGEGDPDTAYETYDDQQHGTSKQTSTAVYEYMRSTIVYEDKS